MLSQRTITVAISILLLCAATLLDFLTGADVSVLAFYALPVAFASTSSGLRAGTAVALLAAFSSAVLGMNAVIYTGRPGLMLWNTLMSAATLTLVAVGFAERGGVVWRVVRGGWRAGERSTAGNEGD